MIYRFSKPILLSDGSILGNADPKNGPLGGEIHIDKDEDNEVQNKVKAQVASEAAEAEAKAKAKAKK